MSDSKRIFIVPHTHWDREWYLPFQQFRFKLVDLIDTLLEILKYKDYKFMLDGQTIVLEDYLEIRPENRERLQKAIQNGNIGIGPWYLLPDEWLIGEESFIRNLEFGNDVARSLNCPVMQVGYLPDQFGHSRVIPQLLGDLTNIHSAVIWRGVGKEITSIPFWWKAHPSAHSQVFTVYLPFGYGNAATLPETAPLLQAEIEQKVAELQSFSPIPYYLLMNGSDHLFPQPKIPELFAEMQMKDTTLHLSHLTEFIDEYRTELQKQNISIPTYAGEFRSSKRAQLLQDTYSARLWIKEWNQRIEDLITKFLEPLNVYACQRQNYSYPTAFIHQIWKYLLYNHPHDSICGCSVDQVHDEMRARFSSAESLGSALLDHTIQGFQSSSTTLSDQELPSLMVWNPSNCVTLQYFEFSMPISAQIYGLRTPEGLKYPIQALSTSEDVFFEATIPTLMLSSALKLLPGRKIMDVFINHIIMDESKDKNTCEVKIICDKVPVGDIDLEQFRTSAMKLLESKQFRRFHVKVTRGSQQRYSTIAPLIPWGLTSFQLIQQKNQMHDESTNSIWEYSKDAVTTNNYAVQFNRDGTFNYFDKKQAKMYSHLHTFEDWGDRGDEYTFGRVGPVMQKTAKAHRSLQNVGSFFCDIRQNLQFATFAQIHPDHGKRIGHTIISITTVFRFYRDLPHIEITTKFTNTAKDHRFRVCFSLPFRSNSTLTATHFGIIERSADLEKVTPEDSYLEAPSGIQAQKRFIRVEDQSTNSAVTVCNQGLPEVEFFNHSTIALTLIRSIGYLSRPDISERPLHAGPGMETPGAQELHQTRECHYAFLVHRADAAWILSADYGEITTLHPLSIETSKESWNPLLHVESAFIRISSLRMNGNAIRVTMYNLSPNSIDTSLRIDPQFRSTRHINLDGTEKTTLTQDQSNVSIHFDPCEIKMIEFT